MGIINRDLGRSTRKRSDSYVYTALATGVTSVMKVIPFNITLVGIQAAAFGLSGTPVYSFSAYRFISGSTNAGFTSVALGVTFTASAYGTSGVIGGPFGATGANGVSNLNGITLLQGDLLVMLTGGANSAVTALTLGVVTEGLDEILPFLNSVG